ncbi:MAG: hypothetical protein RR423_06295 [Hydrogenoanaerobacterium sp.]
MKISKTSRLLSLYHLFRYCEEISYKEVTDLMPVSEKTIYRDICLLRQAGIINPQFSKKRNAFVLPPGESLPPRFPENKSQKLYLEKIIRLCKMMAHLPEESPDIWYHAHYPELSERTRQRDFAELNKIGYEITYQRWDDGDEDRPVGSTYCDFPYDTYSLATFDLGDF